MKKIVSKKSQAAIEYLVTYSWAFIVILGAIGTLTYFDAFNPQKYLPDSCEFGEQLKCADWFIGTNGLEHIVVLRFRNNFEQEIQITSITGDRILDNTDDLNIKAGHIGKITLNVNETNLNIGKRETFDITVQFKRYDATNPNTPQHNLTGKISSKVEDNSLGLV
ncbi:MAG: hypothetical protein PHU51_01580 [Candidatus Nanoarchaeia archaeon]|nr:hypothetical protein [Candidatus Nanoarchaeia archaeon]